MTAIDLPTLAGVAAGALLTLGVVFGARVLGARRRERWADERTRDDQDAPPAAFGTWTCPECAADVPVTATTTHVAYVELDPTDIHAHVLTHEGSPS